MAQHEQAAVEQFADLDARSGGAATGRQPYEAAGDGDGGVAGDDASVAASEGVVEMRERSAPDGAWVASGHGEAPVEVVQERGSEGERGLNGGDAGQVQLGGEPIVESSPEALNAAFGLGSAGRDVADAEFLEGLAELGGSLSPCELFFEGPVVVVAHEGAEAVAIELERQAEGGEHLVEDHSVPMEILLP